MANKFNMGGILLKLQKVSSELPSILANESLNFFDNSFKRQGWEDKGFTKWKKRQSKKNNKGRSILIKSGALRRSIKVKEQNWHRIVITSNLPYSAIHNEGFKGKENVKEHTRRTFGKVKVSEISTRKTRKIKAVIKTGIVSAHIRNMDMPKRQFMGNSQKLREKQKKIIVKAINTCFK